MSSKATFTEEDDGILQEIVGAVSDLLTDSFEVGDEDYEGDTATLNCTDANETGREFVVTIRLTPKPTNGEQEQE